MSPNIVRAVVFSAVLALGAATFPQAPRAEAAPLRHAEIGDRMSSLTVGLNSFPDKDGNCGAVHVTSTGWVVPGRPLDEEHASVVTVEADGRTIAAAVYDEADLTEVTDVYADLEGRGMITHAWPGDLAPEACRIVAHIQ